MRSCVKTGCRWPASATLSFRYATAEVWLGDLQAAHPATHDLCPHHADALTVPRGWTLVDRRQPQEVPHEPSAAEIAEAAAARREEEGRGVQPERSVTAAANSDEPARVRRRDEDHSSRRVLAAAPVDRRTPSRYDALLQTLPLPDRRHAGSVLQETRPELRPVVPTRDLAPVIREMAAELGGGVVGQIEIDLEDDTPPVTPTPAGSGPGADEPPVPPEHRGERSGAEVLRLPLRPVEHGDSRGE